MNFFLLPRPDWWRPGLTEAAEHWFATVARVQHLDLRPVIEKMGLREVIDQIGLDRLIEQAGVDQVLEQIDKKTIARCLTLDDILASLSPAERRELKRRLE